MKQVLGVVVALAAVLAVCSADDDCNKILPDGSTCPPGKGPFFYPDSKHCSIYWQCDNGCATHMMCKMNFLYDDKRQWCNTPQLVDCGKRDCDGRPCKPPQPPIDFKCPQREGLYADDKNCMKYIQCADNIPEVHDCPFRNGLQELYNPEKEWCDWPDRVDCGARPICDKNNENCSHQPTRPPTTTKPPNMCDKFGSCVDEGAMIEEGNCRQCFCECSAARWQEVCCPPNLVFDPSLNQCNWPYNVPEC